MDPDNGDYDLYVMSSSGRNVRLLLGGMNEVDNDHQPSWSSDGRQIAFSRTEGVHSIMLVNADGSGVAPFPPCSFARCASPSWSPSGTQLAYRIGNTLPKAVPTGTPEVITSNASIGAARVAWAPDGARLAYPGLVSHPDGTTQTRLVTISADGTAMQPVPAAPIGVSDPSWGNSR